MASGQFMRGGDRGEESGGGKVPRHGKRKAGSERMQVCMTTQHRVGIMMWLSVYAAKQRCSERLFSSLFLSSHDRYHLCFSSCEPSFLLSFFFILSSPQCRTRMPRPTYASLMNDE